VPRQRVVTYKANVLSPDRRETPKGRSFNTQEDECIKEIDFFIVALLTIVQFS